MKGVFWKPKEKQNPKMSLGFQFDQYLHISNGEKEGKRYPISFDEYCIYCVLSGLEIVS